MKICHGSLGTYLKTGEKKCYLFLSPIDFRAARGIKLNDIFAVEETGRVTETYWTIFTRFNNKISLRLPSAGGSDRLWEAKPG